MDVANDECRKNEKTVNYFFNIFKLKRKQTTIGGHLDSTVFGMRIRKSSTFAGHPVEGTNLGNVSIIGRAETVVDQAEAKRAFKRRNSIKKRMIRKIGKSLESLSKEKDQKQTVLKNSKVLKTSYSSSENRYCQESSNVSNTIREKTLQNNTNVAEENVTKHNDLKKSSEKNQKLIRKPNFVFLKKFCTGCSVTIDG